MMFRNNTFDCSDQHGRLSFQVSTHCIESALNFQDSQSLEFNPLSRTFGRSLVLSALELPRPLLDIEP
jgi:hypothetical protein